MPELSFSEVSSGYHLYFMQGFCDPWTDACLYRIRTTANATHRANYTFSAQVRLTMAQSRLTNTGMEDQLRHEIGPWIGLDEQYNEDGNPACSSRISVMNGSYVSTGLNCKGVHAPTAWDINAVTAFWKGAKLTTVALTEPTSRRLTLTWDDTLWSEGLQRLSLFYWDTNTRSWVLVDTVNHYDGIGFHRDSIHRVMTHSWTIGGTDLPLNKYYIAAVKGWSWPWEEWTPSKYSRYVYVD